MKEDIEHMVKVDENITVTIKIPKVLDALQFKALTAKVNKLFNIAEVPIVARERQKQHRKTEEEAKEIVREWVNSDTEERKALEERLGYVKGTLANKISYWKKKHGFSKEDLTKELTNPKLMKVLKKNSVDVTPKIKKRKRGITWTEAQNKEFVKLVEGGKSTDDISRYFGCTLKQVWDKKYRLKQEGVINED